MNKTNKGSDIEQNSQEENQRMTHVEIQEDLLPLLGRVDKVLDENTGFVEHYDFSRANTSYEARIQAITKVASICYASPRALGSISLFDRLKAESGGLPSSSYEFVPVLFKQSYLDTLFGTTNSYNLKLEDTNILKYGEKITHEGEEYLLTNFRAVIYDFEQHGIDLREHLNKEDECNIIKKHFKVFLFNVDLSTRSQMVRHRVNWQELSRRYVSGKKKEFEFYISEKMKKVYSEQNIDYYNITQFGEQEINFEKELSTDDIINICLNHYDKAIATGVKPEEARRILPQAMMTQIWGAFQPKQLEGFFKLRLDSHAQLEIRRVAQTMQSLIKENV